MQRSGTADLLLHGGPKVPPGPADRTTELGTTIAEHIILEYDAKDFLEHVSTHASLQTETAKFMRRANRGPAASATDHQTKLAKRGFKPRFNAPVTEVVLPDECQPIPITAPNAWNQNGSLSLVRANQPHADNNAVGDGFQIYPHAFVITKSGEWAVVQQGMNPENHSAARSHWHSATVRDFVSDPGRRTHTMRFWVTARRDSEPVGVRAQPRCPTPAQ